MRKNIPDEWRKLRNNNPTIQRKGKERQMLKRKRYNSIQQHRKSI